MLLYATGGVVTAAGALSATFWLLTLTGRSVWPRRRAAFHTSPALLLWQLGGEFVFRRQHRSAT
jgi:hypothetical protein